jgi:hypothetical protein
LFQIRSYAHRHGDGLPLGEDAAFSIEAPTIASPAPALPGDRALLARTGRPISTRAAVHQLYEFPARFDRKYKKKIRSRLTTERLCGRASSPAPRQGLRPRPPGVSLGIAIGPAHIERPGSFCPRFCAIDCSPDDRAGLSPSESRSRAAALSPNRVRAQQLQRGLSHQPKRQGATLSIVF